jgi:PII-like signaling protein
MKLTGKAKMLRIHIGEDDELNGEPLYEAIIKKAREMDIAGATAYRGIEGYGAHKRFHKQKLLALSGDLPILVTIIDTEENIKRFLAVLDAMVTGGCLIALSEVDVIKYTHHSDEKIS